MQWSVGVAAEGSRALTQAEVVELADAVSAHSGIASGIGSIRFGATLLIEAATREEAIEQGCAAFAAALTQAGLPAAPIVEVSAVSDDDEPT